MSDWRTYIRHLDYLLIVATVGLITYGVTMIYFATRHDISGQPLYFVRQGLYDAANASSGTSSGVFAGYDVPVAGKTGTAEVWDNGRFVNYAWYASYAPANDPKYAVVVMIEKGGHGATAAAPATRVIYDALFNIDSGEFTGTVRGD